jgi:hypothetical protein
MEPHSVSKKDLWHGNPMLWSVYEEATEELHLRISDIAHMKPGETKELFFFDRNVWDMSFTKDKQYGKSYTFMNFFKPYEQGYGGLYTHSHDLQGTLKWTYDGETRPFEFEINYTKGHWFPLDDGVLDFKRHNEMGPLQEPFQGRSWKSFAPSTRIGWRGPAVDLAFREWMPNLFVTNDKSRDELYTLAHPNVRADMNAFFKLRDGSKARTFKIVGRK